MSSEMFTTVLLDKPRRIRYSQRALYRHSTLDKPIPLSALSNGKKAFGALVQWLWACQFEDDAFETPEQLADHVKTEAAGDLMRTLIDAVNMGLPPKDSKNESSSTPKPSPGSS